MARVNELLVIPFFKYQINCVLLKLDTINPPGVEKLSRRQELSRSIHQVSRSYRECDKKKLKKLDRQQGIEEVLSQLLKPVFRVVKNTNMNAIQHATQLMIQSTY